MTGQHLHVILFKRPIFGQSMSNQEKNDIPTYKSTCFKDKIPSTSKETQINRNKQSNQQEQVELILVYYSPTYATACIAAVNYLSLFILHKMSSYVENSFYKRAHDSYNMHTFGNYSSLSELQQSNYCHGGLDLSGNTAEQASCNSLKREDMNASLSVRTSTPPEPPSLKHGVEGAMEVTAKPSGEIRGSEIREENIRNQQNCSFQNSNSKQPQIYPWMTRLHMSHGKVYLKTI